MAPPYLIIKHAAKAIEFYKKAFGAKKDHLAPLCVAIVGQVPMIYRFTQISQYLPALPAQLPLPLPGRLARERDPRSHGLRPLL